MEYCVRCSRWWCMMCAKLLMLRRRLGRRLSWEAEAAITICFSGLERAWWDCQLSRLGFMSAERVWGAFRTSSHPLTCPCVLRHLNDIRNGHEDAGHSRWLLSLSRCQDGYFVKQWRRKWWSVACVYDTDDWLVRTNTADVDILIIPSDCPPPQLTSTPYWQNDWPHLWPFVPCPLLGSCRWAIFVPSLSRAVFNKQYCPRSNRLSRLWGPGLSGPSMPSPRVGVRQWPAQRHGKQLSWRNCCCP